MRSTKTAASPRRIIDRFENRAAPALMNTVDGGAEVYDRRRHLPCLLPIGPGELTDESESVCRAILARLARAIRAERSRGRAGHWTYDLNRHVALRQAHAAEEQILRSFQHTRQVLPQGYASDST